MVNEAEIKENDLERKTTNDSRGGVSTVPFRPRQQIVVVVVVVSNDKSRPRPPSTRQGIKLQFVICNSECRLIYSVGAKGSAEA